MIINVLISLKVPTSILNKYASKARHEGTQSHQGSTCSAQNLRPDAWVVGIADPTAALTAGHIFVSGLPQHRMPLIHGQHHVFVTRVPCVRPSDGRLLPVVTSQPVGMLDNQWQHLLKRPFGEIIFPSTGPPLPQSISQGDLDGDLYWVCWDESVVQHVQPRKPESALSTEASGDAAAKLGDSWLTQAQQFMTSPELQNERVMIAKLYRAAEKKMNSSKLGMDDPDAQALFHAYSQAIDMGKHGGQLDLPDHLRKELGIK